MKSLLITIIIGVAASIVIAYIICGKDEEKS